MKPLFASLMASLLLGSGFFASAQSYDDDDIYYNPDKAKKEVKKTAKKASNAVVYDYPSADTYQPVTPGSNNIDVDAYNRRGVFAPQDTTTQKQQQGDFNYTRQIERFHNPDVIAESNDDEVASLYYSQPANINIIVQNDPFAYNYWGYPYYGSSWYWGYSPASWYFNWAWGPSWSWSWGPSWAWGPSWSWGWGPSWAWGPSWNWGWGPSWTPVIPSRPNRPIGNVRPGYNSHQASGNTRPGYRPGSSSRPAYSPSTGGSYRPGNNPSGYRSGSRQSIRNSGSNRGTTRYNNTNNDFHNNRSNYNYSPNNSNTRSQGSFNSGGGYRGGSSGSFGGGRSGGGGGRGRH